MKKTLFVIVGIILVSVMSGCVNKNLLDSYKAHLNITEAEHMNYVKNGGEPLTKEAITARELKYKSARKVIKKYEEYSDKWYIFGDWTKKEYGDLIWVQI